MSPAAGQGALGIEVRADDAELLALFAPLIDRPTWLAVHAERAVSRALGGSCSMPLAAHAVWDDAGHLSLVAALGHPEDTGRALLRTRVEGDPADAAEATALGVAAAARLRELGAADYLVAAA
jgi:hydroxymethylbilane synthase